MLDACCAALLAAAVTAASASVPVLNIQGAYGSDASCFMYYMGGTAAVYSAASSEADFLVVTPDEIVGYEYACRIVEVFPAADRMDTLIAQCSKAGASGKGAYSMALIGVQENVAERTLAYDAGESGSPIVLRRCD